MKNKPLLAIIFLLSCVLQATVTQEVHQEACTPERADADNVYEMAKRLLPYCDQLPRGSVENAVMEAFCDSTRDHKVNDARIRESTLNLRKYMKVCDNSRCELMEKMQLDIEQLNEQAAKLKCNWNFKISEASTQPSTEPTTQPPPQTAPQSPPKKNCTNEKPHAEKVLVMAKRLLPYCDQAPLGSLEFIVLEAFCDSTRAQKVNKTKITTSTMNLRKYMKMCEDPESHGSPKRRRCDWMRRMQPHMEELNEEATKLKCNWKIKKSVTAKPTTPPSTKPSTQPPAQPLTQVDCKLEAVQARKVHATQNKYLSFCDRLQPNTGEQLVLAEFCNSTRHNQVNKYVIERATGIMEGLVRSVCGRGELTGVDGDARCDLLKTMKPYMEILNMKATNLKCNWRMKTKPPPATSTSQEEQQQEQTLEQWTTWQQILLACGFLIVVIPLTVAHFCAIRLLRILGCAGSFLLGIS